MGRTLFILAGLLLAASFASPASAITRSFINCPSGAPCELDLTAHIDTIGVAHLPWVISIPTPAGLCLTAVIASSDDPGVAISIIAPNGLVYRQVPYSRFATEKPTVAGWQTVQIDSFPDEGEQIAKVVLELLNPQSCTN